jgi:hypothetical protein
MADKVKTIPERLVVIAKCAKSIETNKKRSTDERQLALLVGDLTKILIEIVDPGALGGGSG